MRRLRPRASAAILALACTVGASAGMQVANRAGVGRADLSCDFAPAAATGDGAVTVGSVKCLLDVATP